MGGYCEATVLIKVVSKSGNVITFDTQKEMLQALIPLCMPLEVEMLDGNEKEGYAWSLRKTDAESTERLNWLKYPLAQSALVKKAATARAKAESQANAMGKGTENATAADADAAQPMSGVKRGIRIVNKALVTTL